ncbi:Arm DNA-binding domain-containing protein [Ralstonia nicotianae]|uniref:Arm DNA-binding domain-containing protein n=1 Tax=Ralstonia solanacearum species complex TaxID=3116862 RepID=UPI001E3AA78E|nr:Arm DNA-binding domain-containing protein [Ralstonia pseudosolanacearum]
MTAAGARAYVFESRLFGKTIRLTIGDARAWDLGRARTEASRLKTLVDDGKDPREVRVEQRVAHEARQVAQRKQDVSLAGAWQEYLDASRSKWGGAPLSGPPELVPVGWGTKAPGDGGNESGATCAADMAMTWISMP